MNIYVNPPNQCELCKSKVISRFIDAKTIMGTWANMCINCYATYGTFEPEYTNEYVKTDQGFECTKSGRI